MRNMVMENHVIRRDEVPNEGSCRVKCYLEPDCVSINVGPSSGGKLTCELNNATTGMNSTLRSKIDHTYLEISEVKIAKNPFFCVDVLFLAVMSAEEGLKSLDLNETRTLTSAMPVQCSTI